MLIVEEIVNTLIIIGLSCAGVLVGCTAGSIINYRRNKSAKRNDTKSATDDTNLTEQLGRVTELYEKATKLIQQKMGENSDTDHNK